PSGQGRGEWEVSDPAGNARGDVDRQIAMSASVGYGMGWMLRDWRGQPMVLHGGSVPGYSTMVALLPKSDLGIVVLVNQDTSLLGELAANLVPDILLGDAQAPSSPQAGRGAGEAQARQGAASTDDVSPYLGRYVANFATFSNEVFTVQTREGGMALNIPSQ